MQNRTKFEDDLLNILESEDIQDDLEIDTKLDKERVLSIQDPSEIGPDEYLIFLDYAIANIHKILRNKIKTKIPDKLTIKEMGKEVLSLTIATYNIEIAKEKKAALRTHLGWKAMQVVTDYARAYNKASKNELNTNDEEFANSLEENKIQTDIEGNNNFDGDVDMDEYHNTSKFEYEQSKKVEWAMKQVRFELPRENNLILDVGIGEILRADGLPYNFTEWATYTNQDVRYLRKLFKASKQLIKSKMIRKGLMDVVVDQDKTTEDFMKDIDIEKQVLQQEKDEAIIESTDVESLLDSDSNTAIEIDLEALLKGEDDE